MGTACTGRLGAIITATLDLFNDDDQRFLSDAMLVRWCNECQRQIAIKGYFEKDTNISIVASQASYALSTLITDLEDVINVRYNGTSSTVDSDNELLTPVATWASYQNILSEASSVARPYGYHIQGRTMYLVPTPTTALTNGITVHHSYIPSDLHCTTGTTPSTPATHDAVYTYFCLFNAYGRDRHSPMASQQLMYYQQLFSKELERLMGTLAHPGDCLRSYR